jgi:arginine/lysine/ornithine decarboxylase
MYEVGQFLTNAFEVNSGNAVVIEIMATFVDEDDERYYVVKCRRNGNSGHSWYYEDELDLLSEAHLYKYYELVEA